MGEYAADEPNCMLTKGTTTHDVGIPISAAESPAVLHEEASRAASVLAHAPKAASTRMAGTRALASCVVSSYVIGNAPNTIASVLCNRLFADY